LYASGKNCFSVIAPYNCYFQQIKEKEKKVVQQETEEFYLK